MGYSILRHRDVPCTRTCFAYEYFVNRGRGLIFLKQDVDTATWQRKTSSVTPVWSNWEEFSFLLNSPYLP